MADKVSDLEEFKGVDQLKRELISLKRENNAALATIDKLLRDLSKKTEEIKHLQSLVTQVVPVIKKEISTTVTPEEEIAEIQLERLRGTARSRTLTLEEIRAYDLLVKNKRLGQDQSTINLSKANYRDISSEVLIEAASKNDSDTEDHS